MKANLVGWFEIPVLDMDRAIKFYETVFDIKLNRQQMGPADMAWFPGAENGPGASGSLVSEGDLYKPSHDGSLIYFNSLKGDLSLELAKVIEAGGKVLQEKQMITEEIGYYGMFEDSEGNRIALHSRS